MKMLYFMRHTWIFRCDDKIKCRLIKVILNNLNIHKCSKLCVTLELNVVNSGSFLDLQNDDIFQLAYFDNLLFCILSSSQRV